MSNQKRNKHSDQIVLNKIVVLLVLHLLLSLKQINN